MRPGVGCPHQRVLLNNIRKNTYFMFQQSVGHWHWYPDGQHEKHEEHKCPSDCGQCAQQGVDADAFHTVDQWGFCGGKKIFIYF
jgi:hypothetical protein